MGFCLVPKRFLAYAAFLSAAFLSGCASESGSQALVGTSYGDGCARIKYEGERVLFTGFAVPPGTNLEAKTLTVHLDRYPGDLGSTSLGSFVFHKVKYLCTEKYERDAGHVTMHVIYSGEGPTFDFAHRATTQHSRRLAKYDEAAQVWLTRIIMGTYRKLPAERVVITCYDSLVGGSHKMFAAVTSDRTP